VAELSQSVAALEPFLDAAAEPNALPADPVGAAAAKSGNKPGNKPTDKARVATAKKKESCGPSTTDGTLPPTFSTAPAGAVGLVARSASSHSAIGSEPQPRPRRRARVVGNIDLHPPLGYLDCVDVDPVGSKADQDRPSVGKLKAALSDREWLDDPEAKAARS
jgi:hypothetical protein